VGAGGRTSVARLANVESSIGGIRSTGTGIATVTGAGRSGRATGEESGGGPGTEAARLGTETCTLGTETGRLGTETCTLGTDPGTETGTAGVETWGVTPVLGLWLAAGAREGGVAAAGLGETGAAGVGETAAAPALEGVAAGVVGATAAAPVALGAVPATAGDDTAGTATPPALAAASTARWAADRPAWTSELGLTVVTSARASWGSAHASAAVALAIATRHAPRSRRPRLTIAYDGPRGLVSFAQFPTPIRSPGTAGLIRATT
jgi:hypothetical protein